MHLIFGSIVDAVAPISSSPAAATAVTVNLPTLSDILAPLLSRTVGLTPVTAVFIMGAPFSKISRQACQTQGGAAMCRTFFHCGHFTMYSSDRGLLIGQNFKLN